jgi:hypothetical protein
LSILRSLNTLDLNERGVLVLVALGTLVAQNTALAVQAVLNSNMFRLVLRFFYNELCCLWCIFRSMLDFNMSKSIGHFELRISNQQNWIIQLSG